MKQVLVIDMQFIFDANEDDAVWSGSREFEKSQKKVVEDLGGEEQVLSKEIVSDNYAKYIVLVQRKAKEPQQAEITKSIPVKQPVNKVRKIKKGGKLLPKSPDKKRVFSTKKGRRLAQKKRGKPKIGGQK